MKMAIKYACEECSLHANGWDCHDLGHETEGCKALGLTRGCIIPLGGCSRHGLDDRACEPDTCPSNKWHKVVSHTATCDACGSDVLGMGDLYAYED